MKEKTTADWESDKKIMNSGSTSKEYVKEIRTHPAGSRMKLEELARFGVQPERTEEEEEEEEEVEIRTGQDLETNSDEEQWRNRLPKPRSEISS